MIIPNSIFLKFYYPKVSFGSNVQILGIKNTQIGKGTCVGDNSWLNVCTRDSQKRIKIGQKVLIGREALITTADNLEIGDYCVLAPRVYISETDHVFSDINIPILQQGVIRGKKVIIEENCWIGINSVIIGELIIGRGSVIAANSVVKNDVPPFSIVAGTPAKIVKMYNPSSKKWDRICDNADMTRVLSERSKHPLISRDEYLVILNQNSNIKRIHPILAGRGISI